MDLLQSTNRHAEIRCSLKDLLIINNALNEVCHGIDLPEFEIRMGTTLQNAKTLLGQVSVVIDNINEKI